MERFTLSFYSRHWLHDPEASCQRHSLLRALQRHGADIGAAFGPCGERDLVAFDGAFHDVLCERAAPIRLDEKGDFIALHLAVVEWHGFAASLVHHGAGQFFAILLETIDEV